MLSIAEALDDVEIALRQFEFTIKLLSYCELGHIKPEEFDTDHVIRLERGTLLFPTGHFSTQDDIERAANVLVLQAFGVMVIVLDKAFEAAGIVPDPEASEVSAKLRTLVYMARCAQAHGPADPRWEVRGKYRRKLDLDVDGYRIALDLATLDKQPFVIDQIGGYETWSAMYKMAMAALTPLRPKE